MDFVEDELTTCHIESRVLDMRTAGKGYVPAARCSGTLTALGSRLVLIGGGLHRGEDEGGPDEEFSSFLHFDTVDVLDLDSLASVGWRRVEPEVETEAGAYRSFPARRGHTATACGRHQVYVFGGAGDGGPLNDLWLLDLDKGTWKELVTSGLRPPPVRNHIAEVVRDEKALMLVGGHSHANAFPRNAVVWLLDLQTLIWRALVPDASPPTFLLKATLCFCSSAMMGDRLVCWAAGELSYLDLRGESKPTWTVVEAEEGEGSPGDFCAAHTRIGRHFLLVHGGTRTSTPDSYSGRLDLLDLRDVRQPRWELLGGRMMKEEVEGEGGGGGRRGRVRGALPCPRNAGCMAAVGAQVVAFGGGRYRECYFDDVHLITFRVHKPFPPPPGPSPPPLPHHTTDCGDEVAFVLEADAEGRELCRVSRGRVAKQSSVLGAWVGGQFEEGRAERVVLPSTFSGEAWRGLFAFLRGATLVTLCEDGDALMEMLRLADYCEVEHLRAACERLLIFTIDRDQVCSLWAVARAYGCASLALRCLVFIVSLRPLLPPEWSEPTVLPFEAPWLKGLPGWEALEEELRAPVVEEVCRIGAHVLGDLVQWM